MFDGHLSYSIKTGLGLKACFFSNTSSEQLKCEQYSIADIRILKDYGFDIVVANNIFSIPYDCDLYYSWWASGSFIPMVVSKIFGKPNIIVAGGNEALMYKDSVTNAPHGYLSMSFFKRLATRLALRKSTTVTVVSDFMVNDVRLLANREVLVVPNCVDTSVFIPDKSLCRSYITTIFRMDEGPTRIKRGDIFIEAASLVVRKHPNQLFVIIGFKGESFVRLQNLTKELGVYDNFIFTDLINNFVVHEWLLKSKAYVQISDTETFGVAVAEAMSTATPVVVSLRGALPELVGNLGIYVDHNTIDSVANGIMQSLNLTEKDRYDVGNLLRASVVDRYRFENRKDAIKGILQELNEH